MSSEISSAKGRTAAWRISAWATLVFAVGTVIVFLFLHQYVSNEIQRRSDAWLLGEVDVLGDVAERTPKGILYDRIMDEVAELATKEVPNEDQTALDPNQAVFFVEIGPDNGLKLWVGKGRSDLFVPAIQAARVEPGKPLDVSVAGFAQPFRVVRLKTPEGDSIYLGLSERNDRLVLRRMRLYFSGICVAIVLLGFGLVFLSTKRMLERVQRITETAARIGQNDLKSRVPEVRGNDEVAQLARTLNRMLDRIENTVHQLHTITDSLAHDLRSPMTAIRGKLELALLADHEGVLSDPIASAVEELDRLSDFLTKSLDVAEANAGALRLKRMPIDLDGLLRTMIDLYEPSMYERGLNIVLKSFGPVMVSADPALIHRMLANLLDNAIKHLPHGSTTHIQLESLDNLARLKIFDNGPGFPAEIVDTVFEKYAKGQGSTGSGLGLAFVEAVVRAHAGQIHASNGGLGGARIVIDLPLVLAGETEAISAA